MFESGPVGDQTSFQDELDVLAEPHGIGLWLGEHPPQLKEPGFVAFLQYNSIMLHFCHLNNNINKRGSKCFTNPERPQIRSQLSFRRSSFGIVSLGTWGRCRRKRRCFLLERFGGSEQKCNFFIQGRWSGNSRLEGHLNCWFFVWCGRCWNACQPSEKIPQESASWFLSWKDSKLNNGYWYFMLLSAVDLFVELSRQGSEDQAKFVES